MIWRWMTDEEEELSDRQLDRERRQEEARQKKMDDYYDSLPDNHWRVR